MKPIRFNFSTFKKVIRGTFLVLVREYNFCLHEMFINNCLNGTTNKKEYNELTAATYTRRDHHRLKAVENRFNSNRGIHAAIIKQKMNEIKQKILCNFCKA